MKKKFVSVWLETRLAAVVALVAVAALTATAKEAPNVKVSEREVDRSVRGVSYAPVIKRVTPSVVTIESTRTIATRQNPYFDEDFLRRFFGDPSRPEQRRSRKRTAESLGSGVIVSEDGYILS